MSLVNKAVLLYGIIYNIIHIIYNSGMCCQSNTVQSFFFCKFIRTNWEITVDLLKCRTEACRLVQCKFISLMRSQMTCKQLVNHCQLWVIPCCGGLVAGCFYFIFQQFKLQLSVHVLLYNAFNTRTLRWWKTNVQKWRTLPVDLLCNIVPVPVLPSAG